MLEVRPTRRRKGTVRFAFAALAAAVFVAFGPSVPDALAQKGDMQPSQQAQQGQQRQTPTLKTEDIEWFKLCQDVPNRSAPDQKREECATSYEAYNPVTGQLLLMVQAKTVPGVDDQDRFIVTLPIGLFLPIGAQAKIDESEPVQLQFVYCLVQGCVATLAKNEDHKPFLDKLKKGGKLAVVASTLQGQPYVSGIPLEGFTKAMKGKPMEMKDYQKKAEKVRESVMARRAEIEKKRAEMKKQQGGGQQNPQ